MLGTIWGLLYWPLFFLLAGSIAQWMTPGDEKHSWFKTMLVGLGGSWVGGMMGRVFGLGTVTGFDVRSIALGTMGAWVILWVGRKLKSD